MIKIKSFDELTSKELYEILRVRNEVFIVEQNCVYQDCDEKDFESYHIFLEENDEIRAYLRVLKKGISYDEISIGRVLVTKENRGDGLAQILIEKAIEFIEKDLNQFEIRISAQEYLKGFYEKNGFRVVSNVYYEDSIAHIEMIRNKCKK